MMECYIATKIVMAEPMSQRAASIAGLLRDGSIVILERDGSSAPGYKVVYEDGYTSWSPKAVFERASRPITDAEVGLIEGLRRAGSKI